MASPAKKIKQEPGTRKSSRIAAALNKSSKENDLPEDEEKGKKTTKEEKNTKPKEKDQLSPKDAHFKRLNAAISKYRCLGSLLVVGVKDDDDNDDDEGDEKENEEYTEDQISRLRHILINKS